MAEFAWAVAMLATSCAIGYMLYLLNEAKQHVSKAPQDEMFICDIHGAIAKSRLMTIGIDDMEWEYEGRRATGVPYCPLCFEQRVKEARKHFAK